MYHNSSYMFFSMTGIFDSSVHDRFVLDQTNVVYNTDHLYYHSFNSKWLCDTSFDTLSIVGQAIVKW